MASIRDINIRDGDVSLNLRLSRKEYETLNHDTRNLILLSANPESMDCSLTTGTLGNSNRIMLPKKVIGREKIRKLEKKVPAKLLNVNGDVFLLIRIKKSEFGIPKFSE